MFALRAVTPEPGRLPDPEAFLPEEYQVADEVAYLYLPNGIGRSRLASALVRPGGYPGTARNWRTLEALADMTSDS